MTGKTKSDARHSPAAVAINCLPPPLPGLGEPAANARLRNRWGGMAPLMTLVAVSVMGCSHMTQTGSSAAQPGHLTLRVADAAMASGAPEMALRIAEQIALDDPGNVAALTAKGDALYVMGHPDLARGAYRAAIAANPNSVEAQIGLGRTLVRSDPKAAEVAFLNAATRQPDNITALSNLGIALDLQGRHQDAQTAYHKALDVAPDSADVKVNLGLSLALSGQAAEAVTVLHPLAQDTSSTGVWRDDLAAALAMAGNHAEARQVLRGEAQPAAADAWTVPAAPPKQVAAVAGAPVQASKTAPAGEAVALPLNIHAAPVVPVLQIADASAPVTSATPVAYPVPTKAPPLQQSEAPRSQAAQTPPVLPAVAPAPRNNVAQETPAVPLPRSIQPPAPSVVRHDVDPDKIAETATEPVALPVPVQVASVPQQMAAPRPVQTFAAIAPQQAGVRNKPPETGTSEPATAAESAAAASNLTVATSAPVPHAGSDPGNQSSGLFAQLAAVDSEQHAKAEWQRLQSLMPALLADREPAITQVEVRGQTYWRLRTTGFHTSSEQTAFCSEVRGRGLGCW